MSDKKDNSVSLSITILLTSILLMGSLLHISAQMEPGPDWKQWRADHENACIECLDRNGFPNWTYGDWDNISPYMQKVCPCCKPLTLESSAYGSED